MKNLIRLSLVVLLMSPLYACGEVIKGSGNVKTEKRMIKKKYDKISVETGIDLILTQEKGKKEITVEADDNLIHLLKTEVVDGKLRIYFQESVRKVKKSRVYVSHDEISLLQASSGADIECEDGIIGEDLELSASSGADIEIGSLKVKSLSVTGSSGSDMNIAKVKADRVNVSASSGADVVLSGSCESSRMSANSSGDIDAEKLEAGSASLTASSGGDIVLKVRESLRATASSGADIEYLGSPKDVDINKSSGGSVSKK